MSSLYKSNVKVNVNVNGQVIKNLVEGEVAKQLLMVTNQAKEDANYYAPEDTGHMKLKSAKVFVTRFSGGMIGTIRWLTPYARKVWFAIGINIKKKINPNARPEWGKYSLIKNKDKYIDTIASALRRRLK